MGQEAINVLVNPTLSGLICAGLSKVPLSTTTRFLLLSFKDVEEDLVARGVLGLPMELSHGFWSEDDKLGLPQMLHKPKIYGVNHSSSSLSVSHYNELQVYLRQLDVVVFRERGRYSSA
ncbi:hypothetical protein B296_00047633 [Ensete ventricosum]|uniref:Uncharacterized protein n=1 Tax=Ensete ventricosum TaxID=4639 RepID=A0A426YYJ1_ENSVE|nr:hypothetical protein B296_00047633 [Ensete ventricosum]